MKNWMQFHISEAPSNSVGMIFHIFIVDKGLTPRNPLGNWLAVDFASVFSVKGCLKLCTFFQFAWSRSFQRPIAGVIPRRVIYA
jgi:hypothetical protein